jgi:hypothetical protein
MKKILSTCSLAAVLAGASLSFAKDPIDSQIEKTGKPKTETLADAIRWEKAKDAAAAREARKTGTAKAAAKKTSTTSEAR